MADQPGAFRQIDWEESLPFTRIFRSFRLAIQPARLGLALLGVLFMAVWGGILDGLWPASIEPIGPEVWAHWQMPDNDLWRSQAAEARADMLQAVYGPAGLLAGKSPADSAELKAPWAVSRAMDQVEEAYEARAAAIADNADLDEAARKAAISAAAAEHRIAYEQLDELRTRGIFRAFLAYEQDAVWNLLRQGVSVLMLDFGATVRGTNEVVAARRTPGEVRAEGDFSGIGMAASVLLMARGVQWMVFEHPVYAFFFLLGSLAIWSVFGGAVCRMVALNAAREEQISPKTAIEFSTRKFLGFFSAPLLPVIMIVLIGIPLFLGGWMLAIPYLGEVVGGILMILGLLGGFVIALVLVGLLGGGDMLWPTIAVEGSDGFDAMSRSYSYFYSRPWRVVFYMIVATVYGAITYIVLRYFAYVLLVATRWFIDAGASLFTRRPLTGDPGASKLDAMWPRPSLDNLMGDWSPMFGLAGLEGFGSAFIHLWVLLIVLVLCAYLVSYYFAASTIIYFLLRHRVDATDFDDVYVEDEEDVPPVVPAPPPAIGPAEASADSATGGEPGNAEKGGAQRGGSHANGSDANGTDANGTEVKDAGKGDAGTGDAGKGDDKAGDTDSGDTDSGGTPDRGGSPS